MTFRYAYREPVHRYVDIPDLAPREPWVGQPRDIQQSSMVSPRGESDFPIIDSGIFIGRDFQAFSVAVGVTPTLLVQNSFLSSYLILNPSAAVGLTTSVTGVSAQTTAAAGNSQAFSISVAGFKEAHIYTRISAITGTWSIFAQTYDPESGAWFDSQALVNGATTTGDLYGYLGSFGMGTDLAFRWNPDAAGNITFSIGVVLKEGTGGSNTGAAQTVYIGGQAVNTANGFPLLEGQKENFMIDENIGLYGIAAQPLTLRLFRVR